MEIQRSQDLRSIKNKSNEATISHSLFFQFCLQREMVVISPFPSVVNQVKNQQVDNMLRKSKVMTGQSATFLTKVTN